ncbi:MAG: outer rane biosis protein BamB [Verrucomicrobiales bacterium]|nr:outer rane biosis protein BamB [Verrucomicrobiales bacterium]
MPGFLKQSIHLTAILTVLIARAALASDWPQLLGPTRDAVYAGPSLNLDWPKDGPPVLWSVDVGQGYSCPVISNGKVVQCHRLGDDLVVSCLELQTGKMVWEQKHPMKFQDGAYFDSGPRPTPAIKDGRVYVFNTDGYLLCLDLNDGKKVWSRHPKQEFKSSSTWHGFVSSPLVTDKAVILPVGATNAGVVAFNREDGKALWQVLDDKASASSPMLANLQGKERLLIITRSALHCMDLETGSDIWKLHTRKQTSGNVYCASPVVFSNYLFLSGWYKLGAQLYELKDGPPQKLWDEDNSIATHYANVVPYQSHFYGFHGHGWERGGPNLRCIEIATGKIIWEQPQVGSGTIIRYQDNLLILTENGDLQVAQASPKAFKVTNRVQVVGRTTRSYPAIADGFVVIKGPKKLVCLDLRKK